MAIARRPRRSFLRARCRNVARSTAALVEDTKPNSVRIAPRTQTARLNEAIDSKMAPRPSILRIARVLLPFFSASVAIARHFARPFGDLQPVERGLRAGPGLHPPDIADELHEPVGLLDLDRLARGAHRDRRLGERARRRASSADQSTTSRTERPIQSAMPRAEPAGLARHLHRRQPDARRRAGAQRRIGAGGDGDADARQSPSISSSACSPLT